MNDQIKALEKSNKKLQEQIKLQAKQIEELKCSKPVKWEPKKGDTAIYGDFNCWPIDPRFNNLYVQAGMASYTKEQAETVSKELRKVARMWAYKMEFDADFVPDWNDPCQNKFYVYRVNGLWETDFANVLYDVEKIYMSKQCAKELVKKLNSGEVEF